ncbi:MAG: protein translocase subunit SecF [Caldilineaceae bacterium]|nr:protein translocase subunit SecF [Caldilineaceae bacterium]
MYNLVGKRGLWFILSGLLMLPGIVFMIWSLMTHGTILPLAIDYTGGTMWEMRFEKPITATEVRDVFVKADFADTTVFLVGDDQTVQAKLKNIDIPQKEALNSALTEQIGPFEELSFRSIGPSIGAEVSRAAVVAVLIASVLILIYIAIAFRSVSHPTRYGVCAVIAMIHDVLVMISGVAILNWVAGWEVDALFLTAAMTVIGYSVNDTIVVFDRIRENLKRYRSESLATVANRSLIETMQRSLSTQITTLLALVAILVLGGATLRPFMGMLVVGLVSGTYSSIFNATALLVAWDEGSFFPRNNSSQSNPVAGEHAAAA